MQLQNINQNINFGNNRLKYHRLEHIMRNGNNQFPHISPYRVCMRHQHKNLPQHFFEWMDKIGAVVDENRQKVSSYNYVNVIKNELENVKESKLGNCGENSAITLAALIANGVKNFKVGLLLFDIITKEKGKEKILAKRTYNTTHEMVVLNSTKEEYLDNKNKNAIILDSWMGFCGGVQKAADKFHETFMDGTRKYLDSDGFEHTYQPRILLYDLKINTTDELSKDFAENYPELVINK